MADNNIDPAEDVNILRETIRNLSQELSVLRTTLGRRSRREREMEDTELEQEAPVLRPHRDSGHSEDVPIDYDTNTERLVEEQRQKNEADRTRTPRRGGRARRQATSRQAAAEGSSGHQHFHEESTARKVRHV